jgi:hypothetical protein
VWAGLLAPDHRRDASATAQEAVATHRGMPALGRYGRRVSVCERVPTYLFYLPLALRWLALGVRHGSLTLPTLANPALEGGGLWGESKSQLMLQVGHEHRPWLAPFVTFRREPDVAPADAAAGALRRAGDAGLALPIVAKPDLGWQGYGVQRIDAAPELEHYMTQFPPGETMILQQLVPYDGEAGVYYARLPGEPSGKVVGLAFRYFPCVIGDGRSSLTELIAADARARFKSHRHLGATRDHLGLSAQDLDTVPPAGQPVRLAFIGSLRVGGLYKDAAEHITPALSARFDAVARSMHEFYFGRFDIRFESVERLRDGEAFAIIEINGAGSEPIQAWDPDHSIREAYGELFRFQSLMFDVAARNRSRGLRPMPLGAFLRLTYRYARLLDSYPPSG